MKLLLIRHAESQGNREGRLQGRREYPLTDRGERQAAALAVRLRDAGLSAVYASPIRRAMHTAEALAETTALSVVDEPRLQEYDFGDKLSGLTWKEVRESEPAIVDSLLNNDSEFPRYPGEEGRSAFRDRVSAALNEIAERHAGDDAVAVVTHAGPIVVFLMETLGRAYSRPVPFTIDNASITTIEFSAQAPAGMPRMVVSGLNDTCHVTHEEVPAS